MLKLDIEHHASLRGFSDAAAFLRKQGYSHWKSHRLTRTLLTTINLAELEHLCKLLRCTPNDLLRWEPAKNERDIETHPLKALSENRVDENLLSTLNYEQLRAIMKIAAEKK